MSWSDKSRLVALIAALAISVSAGVASASEDGFLPELLELRERAELALYFTKAALLAPETGGAYIDGLLQQVLGGADATSGDTDTIVDRAQRLLAAVDALPVDAPIRAEITAALESVHAYAELLAEEAEALPATAGTARIESLRRMHAYLSAAHGGVPFALPGLADAMAALPNAERMAAPSADLQKEIDLLLPGGTLFLEAGTYVLSAGLVIDKSMILRPAPDVEGAVILTMSDGTATILSIASTAPARVELHQLTCRGGAVGVAIGEVEGIVSPAPIEVLVNAVSILDCRSTGIRLASGNVDLIDCTVSGCGEYGLLVPWAGRARLIDCTIASNGSDEIAALGHRTSGGIDIAGGGAIELRSCHIADNLGAGLRAADQATATLSSTAVRGNTHDGILALDAASLHLEACTIDRNGGFGVRFATMACVMEGEPVPPDPFSGDVTGGGNVIPDDSTANANGAGGICPAAYDFLAGDD